MGSRLLLAAGDRALARFLAAELTREGHDVVLVRHAAEVLSEAAGQRPDLVLLALDGKVALAALRTLRSEPTTTAVPVLVLAGAADPIQRSLGLAAGADDVLEVPYDTAELVARVAGTLQRTADVRALSPLTGLPGNHQIELEIAGRAALGDPYAVCHVDLDEFKGFNDAYGFQRGDELLLLLAGCLEQAARTAGEPMPFVGHIGGDDFVVVCSPEQSESVCGDALAQFDAASISRHDAADVARGWLEVVDRRGQPHRQPLVSVSVGIAAHRGGDRDFRAVVASATEMKTVAKATSGSLVAVDRRG